MKTTIDNQNKTLVVHQECTVKELLSFIEEFKLQEYAIKFDTIVSIETKFIEKMKEGTRPYVNPNLPILTNPNPYRPPYEVYC